MLKISIVLFCCIIIGSGLLPLVNAQNVISWNRATYLPNSSGTVEIVDKDLSLNPMTITTFQTSVWSDSDASGIRLEMVETAPNSGIFLGNVYFSTNFPSSGNRLHVTEGDTVTAEYIDRTLPPPYLDTQQLTFRATALISSGSSSYNTNDLVTICSYSLNGHLLYGSNSCPLVGTPTILSQANQLASDVKEYLMHTDEEYYSLMLNNYHCIDCNLDVSNLCNYDENGHLIPSFSEDQQKVLLDLQANYSFTICPLASKPITQVQYNAGNSTAGTFDLSLDKLVYTPGETVIIHVGQTGQNTNTPISLKILDASSDIKGTKTIYYNTRNISNGSVTFNYTIPQETNTQTTYRYLVQIYQNQQDCCPVGIAYFVTDPDANQISLSHVQVLTLKASPGQTINFTALVQDGLGNTVKNFDVHADLPQTSVVNYLSSNATFDNSTGLYHGEIPIPKSFGSQSLPLQYYLRVTAQGPDGAGFMPVEFRGGIVNIVPSTIPEFPFAILVLFTSIMLVICFNKIKK